LKPKHISDAIEHLKRHDKKLAKVIARNPIPKFTKRDSFEALVSAIIYQQLSGKAAGTILKRFLELYPNTKHPTPAQVAKTADAKMRTAGVSGQKAKYLRDLAEKFLDGIIEPKKFGKMSDEEIREHLIAVKGIGRWTADMFLMFTLHRPDVLPTGDLGIAKGIARVFGLKKLPNPAQMERIATSWRPYATVASWYLWRAVDGEGEDQQW